VKQQHFIDSIKEAHTIAGGSNRSRGLSPAGPITLTTDHAPCRVQICLWHECWRAICLW